MVQLKMDELKIVPDVIPTAPTEVATVKFPAGVNANMGKELTPTQVKSPPTVTWNASNEAFYTLCMTDPDAPSRKAPKFREWHHWLVVNIPGNNVSEGETLSEYIGAGPPKGSGLHRYVILIYKQPNKIKFNEKVLKSNTGDGRGLFSIKDFAKKYGLGNPIAGNAFQAQWDDYVPILYKGLKG